MSQVPQSAPDPDPSTRPGNQVVCGRCQRVLDFSGDPPSFCAYCGQPLESGKLATTEAYRTAAAGHVPAGLPGAAGPLPEAVGGFRLLRKLGAGGMGAVYEAEDTSSGRRVAVKLLAPSAADSPVALERFRQEGRHASMIAHPRCVFVLAADEQAGRPYIVMELMPGETLKDLVDRQGPLPPPEAVAKILDVIEGLQEAHRLGVVHRDVKPSNCFLLPDGRVKVGDFGLSKSLAASAHLTQTGAFLGTPLFASPEQVRGDPVDFGTDVYSVAATLYYLLTGQAPYQQSSATATLARIVSEPPPPLRTGRPEVSPALERVVLRGLERDRANRWRDLDEFRAALLPFVPGHLAIGGMGLRVAAFLIDGILLTPLSFVIGLLAGIGEVPGWLYHLGDVVPGILYFGLLEGRWGCSLGKRWLRLRVCSADSAEPPGWLRGLVRAATFHALFALPFVLFTWLPESRWPDDPNRQAAIMFLFGLPTCLALFLAMVAPMRARNGFRGLHEWLSGTRVLQLPWPDRRRLLRGKTGPGFPEKPADLPNAVGPFAVKGALRWDAEEKVLVGEDAGLGRKVQIWLRPLTEPVLEGRRRDLSRPTRLRWLASGRDGHWQWDAFVAPGGWLLADVVSAEGKLPWRETRGLLLQLADELAEAGRDGTLPRTLTLDQVCVQPNGRLHLLDYALGDQWPEERPAASAGDRSFDLLRQVARMCLVGRARRGAGVPEPIQAPVPLHVARSLDHLAGKRRPYESVEQFRQDLWAHRDRPAEVNRTIRAGHLTVLGTLLALCLLGMYVPTRMYNYLAVKMLTERIIQAERALQILDNDTEFQAVLAELDPADAALLQGGRREKVRARIEQMLENDQADRATRSRTLSWLARAMELEGTVESHLPRSPEQDRREFLWTVLRAAHAPDHFDRDWMAVVFVQTTGFTIFWPLLWVAWALAFRGGFSLPFMGIFLVRSDGRRAGRFRCAWRAAVVWAPVVGLLGLSVFAQARFPEKGSLNWASWWLAVALLPAYVFLALWRPTRSLHDRLAGTYLVPR